MVAIAIPALAVTWLGLAIAGGRLPPLEPWNAHVRVSCGSAIAGAAPWLLFVPWLPTDPSESGLSWSVAGLGALAGIIVSAALRASGAGAIATVGLTAAWSTLVFVPAAALVFAAQGLGLGAIAPIDHGGVLAVHVTAGATGAALMVRRETPTRRASSAWVTIVAVAAVALGWSTWLAAAEAAINATTATTALNTLVAAAGGAAGWSAVQRLRHRRLSPAAVAAGTLSGLVGVSAGAPLFTPVSAATAGVLAGALACSVALARSASVDSRRVLVGACLAAGAAGMIGLGVFGTGIGYIFTGQADLVLRQVAATAAVALWSAAIGLGISRLLWRDVRASRVPAGVPQG